MKTYFAQNDETAVLIHSRRDDVYLCAVTKLFPLVLTHGTRIFEFLFIFCFIPIFMLLNQKKRTNLYDIGSCQKSRTNTLKMDTVCYIREYLRKCYLVSTVLTFYFSKIIEDLCCTHIVVIDICMKQ